VISTDNFFPSAFWMFAIANLANFWIRLC